jgi:hypothetical protein
MTINIRPTVNQTAFKIRSNPLQTDGKMKVSKKGIMSISHVRNTQIFSLLPRYAHGGSLLDTHGIADTGATALGWGCISWKDYE